MEKTDEKITTEKNQCNTVSKLVWLPFVVMFLLTLALLVFSFFDGIPCCKTDVPIKIKFTEQTQLIILGVLMAISLIIPFWAYAMKKAETKTCCGYNYPLGLPKGSIRAIVILIAAAAYVVLTIKGNALEDARNIFILLAILYCFSRIAEAKIEPQEIKHETKEAKEGEATLHKKE